MPSGARVRGADRLAATLARASQEVGEMRPGFDEAGRIIATASARIAPVRTGALRNSVQGESSGRNLALITSPLIYAGPVHWGRPGHNIATLFILRGADASSAQWGQAIEHNAQAVCDSVEGA